MKLATWNVNSLNVRLPHVLEWLDGQPQDEAVDVLVLQETKLTDDKFPAQAFIDKGYEISFFGQKTYNGVAIISKHPLSDIHKNIVGFEDDMARVISAKVLGVRVIGAYFPNGQSPESDKFAYKMKWLDALTLWVRELSKQAEPIALMGDFNITWDDLDVWDPWNWLAPSTAQNKKEHTLKIYWTWSCSMHLDTCIRLKKNSLGGTTERLLLGETKASESITSF